MRAAMLTRILITAGALLAAFPALAWGADGHRITGAIAEQNLSGLAKANVQLLIGSETLAEAATWPDDMKSDPAPFWQKTASPWHYVTVAHGDAYKASMAPPEGDAITALGAFTATLQDPAASIEDKRTALRFVVHIIGDLHQPLHVGRGNDRGGNDTPVAFFNRPTNLHSLWDSGLIEQKQLSFSEYASFLSRAITPEDVIAWSDPRPDTWMTESVKLREQIYPQDPKLSWSYAYQHRSALDGRLKQAGIRIASYLNWLFSPGAPDKSPHSSSTIAE
ncbi:S1/P1 nuclease [uncultured Sphingomonas sp.]|uniref:S1/P1 nuclease n=1 Tax=uncultured Sphingomonas sp. TaxID=158754 RepID=UPI0025CFD753|nr:S1/P1 nuclease [uncultured Sphingomonas sp.]